MSDSAAPVSAGRTAVDDAEGTALVLEARALRRRARMFKSAGCLLFFGVGFVVVAGIAIPNFIKFNCRARQSEAKASLRALWVSEQAYRGEKDEYSVDFAAIGFESKAYKQRYRMVLTDVTNDHFVAWAVSDEPHFPDVWRMDDDDKEPQHLVDACQ